VAPPGNSRQVLGVRCVFFGTAAIAVPTLDVLTKIGEVVVAVCQPDRPGGRGLKPQVPAVKSWANARGLRVAQPDNIRDGELAHWISDQGIDVSIVLAYGRVLPLDLLNAPRLGSVNFHASLLPRHRGAAPVAWSILSGDTETGVSLMQMDAGLDTGPVLVQHKIEIDPRETAGNLTDRISKLCAHVARVDMPKFIRQEFEGVPQNNQAATWAPPIRAADRRLDFTQDATVVDARVRAMTPAPGAVTSCRGRVLRVLESRPLASDSGSLPGTVAIGRDRRILVSTRAGSLEIIRAQIEGKKPLYARDLINGRAIVENDRLGDIG
jgi:methionyl-tRNA formyltransferase